MYLVYLVICSWHNVQQNISFSPTTQAPNWVKAIQSTLGAEQINAFTFADLLQFGIWTGKRVYWTLIVSTTLLLTFD